MVVCKQGEDVHTNIWSQMVCDGFRAVMILTRIWPACAIFTGKKSAYTMDLLDKHLAPYITYHPIDGGLFLWCTLPAGVDMPAFCKQAVLRKVCVVPGNAFLTDEAEPCQSFRINYSTPTDEQLAKGIQILGGLIREIVEK